MNMKVLKPPSSSIFAYGYCLLFFFLVSFDISKAQTATIDPFEGTIPSLPLSPSVCVYVVINCSFHFISTFWYKPLKSVYINCNKPNLYRVGSKWNCSKAHHMGFNFNVGKPNLSIFMCVYVVINCSFHLNTQLLLNQ